MAFVSEKMGCWEELTNWPFTALIHLADYFYFPCKGHCQYTVKDFSSAPLFYHSTGDFEISPSGYILVKKALDAEVKSVFNLTVEAKDERQPRRFNTVSF